MKSVSKMRLAEDSRLFPRLSAEAVESWHKHGEVVSVDDGIGFAACDLGSPEASQPSQEPRGRFYNKRLTLRDLDQE